MNHIETKIPGGTVVGFVGKPEPVAEPKQEEKKPAKKKAAK